MLNIAIVEDDAASAKLLERYVQKYFQETGDAYRLELFSDGLQFISDYIGNANVVFMDIEMPHLDGMTTAKKLRAIDSTVSLIFVTNMAKYALKGYEVDALDFMLKPVEYFNFSLKMDKAVRIQKKYSDASFLVETADGAVKLNVSEIMYVESDRHFVIYHTESGDYRTRATMTETEARLAPKGFARAANSYLVSLAHVAMATGGEVRVGKSVLPISRGCKKSFLDALSVYYSKAGV